MSNSALRLSTAQRQCLPDNIREHLTALYAENDSLAKQVKGLKAKNNELIREHIEMVKDKNSFGIQLQNQKLDIKRLTTLQSIHTGKQFAPRIATSPRIATDVSTSKSQTDENFRPFFLTPKANLTENSYQTAVDRRMSSFFAINQLSDELAQVQVAERSINIENIDPGRSPKFQDALIISISSTSEKNAVFERKLEQTQDEIRHSSICEVPLIVSVNGIETQKSRAKSQVSKTPRIGELMEKVPTKQSVVQTPHEVPQGNASRQRSQVNYKELSLNSKLRQGDEHSLKAPRTFQPTRGSNARDKTALKQDSTIDY